MAIPKKPRKCRVCKTVFQPVRCLQSVCSAECALEQAKAKRAKNNRLQAAVERKAVKLQREKLKTRGDYLKEAQQAFNQYIRLRDQLAGHPCISSGRPLDWSSNAVDAGHWRSTGSAPHLRFDERNCHAQSKHDNRYLAGNAVDYRIGLIARIGLAEVEALEADQTPRKWTIEQLKEIRDTYRCKLKVLRNKQAIDDSA
jgi:hypothetical protein